MRKILFVILPILIILTLVFIGFGLIQAKSTKEKFMDDLEAKAKTVAESMELSVQYALASNDLKTLNRLAERFQKRKRLQGCVIYDQKGKVVAITERFLKWEHEKPYIRKILAAKDPDPEGLLEKYQEHSVYSYALPILTEQNKLLGIIEVIYDTSAMFNILTILWQRISVTLIILIVLITVIIALIQHKLFILPIRRLTDWFQRFQKGETDKLHTIAGKDEIKKLATEVEQVALSLRVARRAISDKAHDHIVNSEIWNDSKLRALVHAKLGENSFIVVSNREPFMHVMDEATREAKCIRPAGGVVAAIDPILCASGGTWIAHGAGNADKKFVNSKNKLGVPPEDNRYILKRVWLTKEEETGYYYGFSNEGLWPLCSIVHIRPIFREDDWQIYKQVNQKFADAVLEELPANNPIVFIQDYHFTLLAKMIKDKRPDAIVVLFWHIPWPNPEVFSICPYQQEILNGMMACDLIGFHLQYYCNNFIDTVNRSVECRVDMEKFSIVRTNNETLVRAFPISISCNFPEIQPGVLDKIRDTLDLHGKIVAVGVDRLDYTKGIAERLRAIDRFLDKYPQYKTKFVFIQIAAPSRTYINSYHDLMGEVDELVTKINWKHTNGTWKPVIYFPKHFSFEQIHPYYALADICIVSSLHDGMNLVAKEYVISKNDAKGMLILSCFAGAAKELTDAVIISPYATEEFADKIKLSIEMPLDEKERRMRNMQQIVSDNNVYKWASSIINEIALLKKTTK